MDCVEIENHYMKIEEVNLLLAGLNITSFFGIAVNHDVIPKKENVNRILISLYQKDIIDWEQEQIVVKQPYSDILYVLSKSRKCVVLQGESEEHSSRCCYFHEDKIVVAEKSQREEDMLCMALLSWNDWIAYIEEYIQIERAYLNEMVKVSLELRDSRTGEKEGMLLIREHGLDTVLIRKNEMEETAISYTGDVLRREVENWLREAEK